MKNKMDIYQLKWIKNVKNQNPDKYWAYENKEDDKMPISEAKIFRLNWRSCQHKVNAQKPRKGDLMLLLQQAKVTHVIEFLEDNLDNNVYNNQDEWGIHRIVKALWMPPQGLAWINLPHQREFFGFDYVVGDGYAHDLTDKNYMPNFHQHWDNLGGLQAFQNHVNDMLKKISEQHI